MSQKIKPGHVLVEVVQGVEGPSLSIGDNDTGERVAGPKPWGGGRTSHSFQVAAKDLVRLAKEYAGAGPVAPVERDDAVLIDALRTCEKWFVKHSPTAPLIGGFGDAEHPMLTCIRAALALRQ